MASLRGTPPAWFRIVAVVIVLWGMMGIVAFYMDVAMSDAARAQLSDYDRNMLASRPGWFIWLYGISVWSGLFGAVALLLRSSYARLLFVIALVTVIAMFGFIFSVTDLLSVKGLVAAAFPVFIVVAAGAQVGLAQLGIRKAWLT